MLSASSRKFLEDLLKTGGPSGFEMEQARVYRNYLKKFADTVTTDVMGNTIARLNPKCKYTFLLDGHYDEIGFQVVNVMKEGLISFRAVGGIDPLTLPGTEVEILTDKGHVPGVIGRKPIHLQTEEERKAVPKIKDMWIDIGAGSKEDAAKIVRTGDPVIFRTNYRMLSKTRILSKSLDDKIGAFVIAEAFRILSQKKISIGVACVGAVQEELGYRGAIPSSFGIDPAAAIAVDVGFATEVPGISEDEYGALVMGKGAGLTRNADNNPVLLAKMMKAGDRKKIPYQVETGHRSTGGTDTSAIQMTKSGVAACLISIPNRYMHTPVEICDLADVEAAINLIVATLESIKLGETFIPGIDK